METSAPKKGGGGHQRGRGSFWKRRKFNKNQRKPSSSLNSSPHVSYNASNRIDHFFSRVNCPFKAWNVYFPKDSFDENSQLVSRIKYLKLYLESKLETMNMEDIEAKKWFFIDCKTLMKDADISEEFDNVVAEINQNPEFFINGFGLCMSQIILDNADDDGDKSTAKKSSFKDLIHCRIIDYTPVSSLHELRASHYGRFVCVKGTVVRISNIKSMCVEMNFECSLCSEMQVFAQPNGKYSTPNKCLNHVCSNQNFIPHRNHVNTNIVDWQSIRLQEVLEDEHRESGRIPRIIECELASDLTDSCVPGDVVVICGIVKVVNSDDNTGRQPSKDKGMFLLYIEVNSLTKFKSENVNGLDCAIDFGLIANINDWHIVQEIQATPNLFKILVHSLCPSIYGHELVKAGLILAFFGGTVKYKDNKNCIPVRGDLHILVIGDPGLGKSQMLHACSNIVPRGVYVCGNTTTTCGLTVTLTKESGSSDYSFEAGALVLADQGCCCIDEFDKMGAQHQALLEAMEQQSISVAKAGIVCSLPARTSLLAAANPTGGSYNKAKTVSENLKMSSAILSRFDLVFILIDKSNEKHDEMLSEHIMSIHTSNKSAASNKRSLLIPASSFLNTSLPPNTENSLNDSLKLQRGEVIENLPHSSMRKYIAYARQYVNPKLSPEAATLIQQFYLDLRRKHLTHDSTPITTRQLESLIRLGEARAKLELREIVTADDAKEIIELMKFSMIDTHTDEFGNMDFTRSQHGSGMSKQSQTKKFISILTKLSEETGSKLFSIQQMKEIILNSQLKIQDSDDLIHKLNAHNYILQKGPRLYQLQT